MSAPKTPRPHWPVQGVTPEDFPRVVDVYAEPMILAAADELRAEGDHPLAEHDRILVAMDQDRMIGTAASYALEMTMPGGPRTVAGVTGVGVWPTHRRQGVLASLMGRQLADIHDRGEPLAAMWASEGAIYGRFGYGPAVQEVGAWIGRPHANLETAAPTDPDLTLELLPSGRARQALAHVHRTVTAHRLGGFQRGTSWWGRRLGSGATWAAVVTGPEGPLGYALYETVNGWEQDGAASQVKVKEIEATTPAAHVALYRHLFSRDLVSRVSFEALAVDAPLLHLIADRNRLVESPETSLRVRLVDVARALSERPYAAPVRVNLAVGDRYAPWNQGTWSLRTDHGGARCERTEADPDLTLDVRHLGATYLGQRTLTALVRAGLVHEHAPGAAARLDLALHQPRAAFCGMVF